MSSVDVTVVIPSTGRASLTRAISSVRAQVFTGSVEVVVVLDRSRRDQDQIDPSALEDADRVIWTGGGRGAAHARNCGMEIASGRFTAFLDDDDEWLPEKLAAQIERAEVIAKSGNLPVVACRHVQVDSRSNHESAPIPRHPYVTGNGVAAYLFANRRPGGGRASIYTSTLLCGTEIREHVRWNEDLKRHQDWDWLIHAEAAPNTSVYQLRQPLVRIHTGSSGSISASTDWSTSVMWADDVLSRINSKVYVDFLAAQSLRYALSARSLAGTKMILSRIHQARRVPSLGPLIIGIGGGLAPRATVERAMTWIR